jgi:hypothetical protein
MPVFPEIAETAISFEEHLLLKNPPIVLQDMYTSRGLVVGFAVGVCVAPLMQKYLPVLLSSWHVWLPEHLLPHLLSEYPSTFLQWYRSLLSKEHCWSLLHLLSQSLLMYPVGFAGLTSLERAGPDVWAKITIGNKINKITQHFILPP